MKAYTDLEQSKKLADILPIESADHHYVRKVQDSMGKPVDGKWSTPKYGNPNSSHANYMVMGFTNYEIIPCWSIATLLNMINTNYYTTLYHDGVAWNIDIIHHDNVKEKHSVYANTPIDACYEMILKLKNLNLL